MKKVIKVFSNKVANMDPMIWGYVMLGQKLHDEK